MKTTLFKSKIFLAFTVFTVLLILGGTVFALKKTSTSDQSPPPATPTPTLLLTATERQLAPAFGDINAISWSPEGSKIAYSDVNNMAITDIQGNTLESFVGRSPTWNPIGNAIAFISPFGSPENNEGIVLLNVNSNQIRRLTSSNLFAFSPSWNPDGAKLLFTMGQKIQSVSDEFQIWMMNSDGSNQKQITEDQSVKGAPRFSPDGSKILYSISVQDTSYAYHNELWVMNADGSNQKYLGIDNPLQAYWSPDGEQILVGGGTYVSLVDSDGSNPKELARGKEPRWNPDGTKIAYTSHEGNIWMMGTDGTNKVQLTKDIEGDGLPVWSPDGTKIAFRRDNSLWLLEFPHQP